jgi:hypothetical protein
VLEHPFQSPKPLNYNRLRLGRHQNGVPLRKIVARREASQKRKIAAFQKNSPFPEAQRPVRLAPNFRQRRGWQTLPTSLKKETNLPPEARSLRFCT